MSAPLPPIGNCLPACSESTITQIPGPQGPAGTNGVDGVNGIDSYTITTAAFVQPAVGNNVTVAVDDSAWMVVGQKIFVGNGGGYYDVFAVPDSVSVTLTNLGYTGNAAPTVGINGGTGVSPGGVKGADGINVQTLNSMSPTTTRGDLIADDGNGGGSASDVRMPVGTDGQVLAGDSTQAAGLRYSTITPNTATDNAISRFDGTTGTPCALQNSGMAISDDGAIQSTPTGGNARGIRATDLQTIRFAADQVASGASSAILGGVGNKSSGGGSIVVGGSLNVSSNDQSFVGGGISNSASGQQSTVGGGQGNSATGLISTVAGGGANTASGVSSTVCGGSTNQATGDNSFVGAGNTNQATSTNAVVCGGATNVASGVSCAILGGAGNQASTVAATVAGGAGNIASNTVAFVGGGSSNLASGYGAATIGGQNAVASKFGQISHSSGRFAANGDCQTSELMLRLSTADATPTELFLDGVSARAVVPLNTVWAFTATVVGRSSTGVCASWEIRGAIQNNANTVTLVSATTNQVTSDGTGGTWGAIGNVAVNADNTNKSLQIVCTGAAATAIRWGAKVSLMEIGY